MMTASSAEMNAVRTNVANAAQNFPDLPAQIFAFRGFFSRESGVGEEDASSGFMLNSLGGWLGRSNVDMVDSCLITKSCAGKRSL